jgi:hypothetical protein
MKRTSTYSAARGAQLAWVRSAGTELARENIRINAIAQNFVENPTYFPPELQSNPAFQERLKREVPLGRLVTGDEDALFAAYLASDAAACFVGQVFPVAGGWGRLIRPGRAARRAASSAAAMRMLAKRTAPAAPREAPMRHRRAATRGWGQSYDLTQRKYR